MTTKKIAIMGSGRGSNAKELILHAQKIAQIEVSVVVSDKPEAPILEMAKSFDIPARHIPHKDLASRLQLFDELQIEWVFLAGYMRIVKSEFLSHFYDKNLGDAKVINIHPSLLPKYRGLNAYEQCFEAGDPVAGITVHLVNEELDAGKCLLQATFARESSDSFSEFQNRGLAVEHKLFPKALHLVADDKITNDFQKIIYQNLLEDTQ